MFIETTQKLRKAIEDEKNSKTSPIKNVQSLKMKVNRPNIETTKLTVNNYVKKI